MATTEDRSKDEIDSSDLSIRRMTSFAVMTVDWSSHGRSYLDNFLGYVLAVIPPDSPTALARDSVRPLIAERFNLSLPSGVVQQLVQRAIKLGYLSPVGQPAIRMTDKGRKEIAPIPYTLKKLAQEQEALARRFVEWADSELSISFGPEQATAILLDYVETYYCSLMSLADGDGSIRQQLPKIEPSAEQKIAAAFVAIISEQDEDTFESIANLARGSMMVNALYSPSLVDSTRGFRHTTIYLDTKIVLRALGYEGVYAEQSTVELIGLLISQGARLAVFEFTLDEIRAVIDAVSQQSRNGRMWTSRPGSVESYFYKLNAGQSLIEQHSIRVESKILDLGMYVDPKPGYENYQSVIDEAEIEDTLTKGNPNYRTPALKHDVDLICAVVRIRAGRARSSLEESRATFMTLNSLVVYTAREAQQRYKEPWPLAMFEMDIAALTWVKEPLKAPNLPRQLLLSTSLGLLNPGRHDWGHYIAEIGRLLDTTAITDNDVVLLRQRYEMDRLAFINRSGTTQDSDRKSAIQVSIEAARTSVEAELTAPIRAEAAAQRAESDELASRVLKTIWSQGNAIKLIVNGLLLVAAVLAISITFVPGTTVAIDEMPGGSFILWGLRGIAAFATVLGGLSKHVQAIGARAQRKFMLHRLQKLNVTPNRAATLGYAIE